MLTQLKELHAHLGSSGASLSLPLPAASIAGRRSMSPVAAARHVAEECGAEATPGRSMGCDEVPGRPAPRAHPEEMGSASGPLQRMPHRLQTPQAIHQTHRSPRPVMEDRFKSPARTAPACSPRRGLWGDRPPTKEQPRQATAASAHGPSPPGSAASVSFQGMLRSPMRALKLVKGKYTNQCRCGDCAGIFGTS